MVYDDLRNIQDESREINEETITINNFTVMGKGIHQSAFVCAPGKPYNNYSRQSDTTAE
jgi:hypothetical protein